MNFAFFGRLEYEKGFDYFLQLAKASVKQKLEHNFIIFGDGSLKKEFYSLHQTSHFQDLSDVNNLGTIDLSTKNQIIYLGKKDFKSVIKPILKNYVDFTIIPSKMLETFGLTALESIAANTDIISTNQPSLQNFNLQSNYLSFDIEKDLNLLSLAEKSDIIEIEEFKAKYSPQNWISNFKQYLPQNCKKILIISDFINKIGGTEVHIHNTKKLLEKNGFHTEILGSNKTPSLTTQLLSLCNILENKKFKQTVKNFKPDLIWFHSVQRYLGNKVLQTGLKNSASKFITIHDLGLFTEYPSKVTSIQDFNKKPSTIAGLVKRKFIQKPMLKSISQFDRIFVPSHYLKENLETSYNINLTVLEHFHD